MGCSVPAVRSFVKRPLDVAKSREQYRTQTTACSDSRGRRGGLFATDVGGRACDSRCAGRCAQGVPRARRIKSGASDRHGWGLGAGGVRDGYRSGIGGARRSSGTRKGWCRRARREPHAFSHRRAPWRCDREGRRHGVWRRRQHRGAAGGSGRTGRRDGPNRFAPRSRARSMPSSRTRESSRSRTSRIRCVRTQSRQWSTRC